MVPRIGRIWLQGPDGKVHNTALYDLPIMLREAVLHVNGGVYQQTRQEPNGTWIYRYEGPLGARPSNPDVKNFRNTDSPEWDGPAPIPPIATWDDVERHFQRVLGTQSTIQFRELHRHFMCAKHQEPY